MRGLQAHDGCYPAAGAQQRPAGGERGPADAALERCCRLVEDLAPRSVGGAACLQTLCSSQLRCCVPTRVAAAAGMPGEQRRQGFLQHGPDAACAMSHPHLAPSWVVEPRACRLSAQTLCLPLAHIALRLEQCAAGSWPAEAPALDGARLAACLRQVLPVPLLEAPGSCHGPPAAAAPPAARCLVLPCTHVTLPQVHRQGKPSLSSRVLRSAGHGRRSCGELCPAGAHLSICCRCRHAQTGSQACLPSTTSCSRCASSVVICACPSV